MRTHQEQQVEAFVAKHVEDLLRIATFLTSLRGVMQQEGFGWIRVHDVATVLDYRRLLHDLEALEHQRHAYRTLQPHFLLPDDKANNNNHEEEASEGKNCVTTTIVTTPLDTEYEQLQQKLLGFGPRIARIHAYWQEIEILLTRALVTEDCRLEGNLYWNMPFRLAEEKENNKKPAMGVLEALWQQYTHELQQEQSTGDKTLFPDLLVTPDAHTWTTWALELPNKGGKGETDSPYSSILLRQRLKCEQGALETCVAGGTAGMARTIHSWQSWRGGGRRRTTRQTTETKYA
eukprot:scaffold655_cov162-Amphora_coffeaeformis.AAC.11